MAHVPQKRSLLALGSRLASAGGALVLGASAFVACRCVSTRQQAAPAAVVDAAASAAAAPVDGGASTAAALVDGGASAAATVAQEVFAGGLKNNWEDYGWTDREINGPGPARLRFGDWGGWILSNKNVPGTFGGVVLKVKAPKGHGDFLELRLESDLVGDLETVEVTRAHQTPLSDGWVRVLVPMRELNPYGAPFDRLRLRAFKRVSNEWVLVDGIALTTPSKEPVAQRAYPMLDGTMRVRCEAPSRPISPLIYGVANDKDAADLRATARRMGGNPTSRYNWQLADAWNTGSDYFFQNVQIDWTYRTFIDTGLARNAYIALTVPIIGWVAKDRSSYSFPVSVFGRQKEVDPDHADIGNGVAPNGKELKAGDPLRTSIPATPEWVRKWVETIREEDKRRGVRSVRSYILDNEPALWNSTHRDVHPEPLTYDELLDRTIRYGSAVRAADPEAVIAGPAEWGWPAYFFSAKDAVAGFNAKPDRRAHGDVPLLAWYLAKLREHEQRTGIRVLDVVDLHFYPQGKGIFENGGGGATDLDTVKRRFRSTRALWDPDYVDESWINEKIRLIPRLTELIAENYPGRGISIGEWNFGAEGHISGALALAEALGRFAQGGITSAYYWTAPKPGTPAYWAFRAFRNFDGQGGSFLDRYVESTAPEGSSLFVSKDAGGTRLVAIALNFQNTTGYNAKIDLSSCGKIASRRTLAYSGQPAGFGEPKTTGPSGSVIEEALLPYSITVFDVKLAPATSAPAK